MTALYLDNDVNVRVAPLLAPYAATTTASLRRFDAGDEEQLYFAAQRRWILLTHNWRDYKLLHFAWLYWSQQWGIGQSHAGILVLEHGSEQQTAAAVLAFLAANAEALPANTLHRYMSATGWQRY